MQVAEVEGLSGINAFIAALVEAREVYANAQKAGLKTIHVDWHAKPLPGGTPKHTRIEIKVLREGSDA